MSDPAEVDEAIFAALSDPTLLGLLPDGVYFGQAGQGKTRYVVFTQPAHEDLYEFQDEAFERFTYLVKAITKGTSTATADAAAARIRTLMEGITTITGYIVTSVERVERVKFAEPDPDDVATVWQHNGGLYELLVQPTA